MIIPVNLGAFSYDIVVKRGALEDAGDLLDLNRRVLVVTDDGVPGKYAASVAARCARPTVVAVKQGEGSKSFDGLKGLLSAMLEGGFTRGDCVAAVGGGVVGDLAGFAAAAYMRGVDFYNIPTTVLSQIDSSIGGKTAINFGGVKNIVGAFHQPKKVVIDPDVLSTLPRRQWSNGLAEAVKMALTSDKRLFELMERESIDENLDDIIVSCLKIKKDIVEKDEKESGLRRMLNFGHTIGHGIESAAAGALYHGECVALGMLPMCSDGVRARLLTVMKKLGLPTEADVSADAVCAAMLHDKKMADFGVTAVRVDSVGEGYFKRLSAAELTETARAFLKGGFSA